ncbi:CPBP family glutamic-type intramembrane protease [Cytobacillus purgationiresistens]|uniref:CPBP family glutamic-type intramembrane protease n=1 Tax=Cytobacillus purgationiresistens TaxID=863449 RepID=UPI003520D935
MDRYTSSSFIFATVHGFIEVFPIAFLNGLAAGFLFYRTSSIWPGVMVHILIMV